MNIIENATFEKNNKIEEKEQQSAISEKNQNEE